MSTATTRDIEAPPRVRAAVDELLRTRGERFAADRLQLGRATVTRIAGGYPCRRGSIIAAAMMLGLGEEAEVRALFEAEAS